MSLIVEEVIPKKFENFTNILIGSTEKNYLVDRKKKVKYYQNLEIVKKLIDSLLEEKNINKELLKNEIKFLKYTSKVLNTKNQEIGYKEFTKLLDHSFVAVVERLLFIEKQLNSKFKQNKLIVSKFDSEYFFAIQNLLMQVEILLEEIKKFKWDNQTTLQTLGQKSNIIYSNLHKIILTILHKDHDSIKGLSDLILSEDKITFDIDNKILA